MRILACVVVATFLASFGAGSAWAEAESEQGYFSAMGTYLDDDKNRNVDDGLNGLQLGIGYAFNDYVNIEGIVSAAGAEGNPGQDQLGIGVDFQRVFRRAEAFSPYILLGGGYFKTDTVGSTADNDGAMLAAGAGAYIDLFSSNIALRAEWRHRKDTVQSRSMDDNLFSIGLQFPFGDSSPKFVDSDHDGVEDGMDRCPNTPIGASVDVYGCEVDSDGDGVKDSLDKCPGTPAGIRVNSDGCSVDSDGDGVTDDKDKCPDSAAGAVVDENGCELDSDNDGVVDRIDECPNSAAGAQVDIKGCEIKSEIALQGVNFESNSDRLLPGAESVLNDAAATLRKNPTIKVEVSGHTDSDGAADFNESLSARRATTVHDYLADHGVAVDRLTVRGYGETQPIADNSTAAGKAQNRRVVLRIIER